MSNAFATSGSILGNRQGYGVVRHSYLVSGVSSIGSIATPIVIDATVDQPVILEGQLLVVTADGGSTPTVSFGYTGSGFNDLVSGASIATGSSSGVFLPASNVTGKKFVTATQTITFVQGGTPNGTGVYYLIVDVTPMHK